MKKKKKIIIALAIILAVGIVSGAVLLILNQSEADSENEELSDDTEEAIGMYGSTVSYTYYPIVENLDFNDYPEYLELDSNVHYKNGAETIIVDNEDASDYGKDVKLLCDYIQYAKDGDYESLNALFSENYYAKYEPYYSFTKQMIYDILLDKLGEETVDDVTYCMYDVSYKIYRNNGTFRNDIGKDSSRVLYFRIAITEDSVLIDNVEYYK